MAATGGQIHPVPWPQADEWLNAIALDPIFYMASQQSAGQVLTCYGATAPTPPRLPALGAITVGAAPNMVGHPARPARHHHRRRMAALGAVNVKALSRFAATQLPRLAPGFCPKAASHRTTHQPRSAVEAACMVGTQASRSPYSTLATQTCSEPIAHVILQVGQANGDPAPGRLLNPPAKASADASMPAQPAPRGSCNRHTFGG